VARCRPFGVTTHVRSGYAMISTSMSPATCCEWDWNERACERVERGGVRVNARGITSKGMNSNLSNRPGITSKGMTSNLWHSLHLASVLMPWTLPVDTFSYHECVPWVPWLNRRLCIPTTTGWVQYVYPSVAMCATCPCSLVCSGSS